MFVNNGKGEFVDSTQARLLVKFVEKSISALMLVDVDGDKDLDVVAGRALAPNEIWLNDGGGVFRELRRLK